MTCKFCGRRLYPNNRSGRCHAHRRWVDVATCKIQGCGKRIRKDCQGGYCREHRAFFRVRRRIKVGTSHKAGGR